MVFVIVIVSVGQPHYLPVTLTVPTFFCLDFFSYSHLQSPFSAEFDYMLLCTSVVTVIHRGLTDLDRLVHHWMAGLPPEKNAKQLYRMLVKVCMIF